MKAPLTILFIVLWGNQLLGQGNTEVQRLTTVSAQGLVLDKGWKFRPGDDIRWADRAYNDGDWQPINPIQQLHKLPEVTKAGIGWFRIKLVVDSSLFNKTIAVGITSIGASEFYLNGVEAYRFGIVSRNAEKEVAHLITGRHFSLQLGSEPIQVLAVRYSFNRKNLYLNFGNAPFCLRLIVKDINESYRDYLRLAGYQSLLRSIQVSFYMPLGLLIFVLYFSFKPHKEYLYFGSFCVAMFAAMGFQFLALIHSLTVTEANICLLLSNIFSIAGPIYWLKGTYLLFEQRRGWPYRIVLILAWLNIPIYFSRYGWSDMASAAFSAIATIDFIRLNIIGVRNKKPGSKIFMAMSLTLFGLLLTWIFMLLMDQYVVSAVLMTICLLVAATGLSFFIAADFARTGSALIARVDEVEKLSELTIAQEKDKQQLLAQQNITLEREVTNRTTELKQSLEDLKATQSHLIQSEKMASLGQLTAGIAHEIQNPLNFVNNFSDVNAELIDELQAELKAGNNKEAIVISNELKKNEQKINHHGKRADTIVKGMLQHTRASTGKKESTNINALVDKYLRLSYHGLRAKDHDFNANCITDFDESVGKIEVAPQDIGRVLLNLYNNAFYAASLPSKGVFNNSNPTVWVSTKKEDGRITISVRDNGPGIPEKVIDKIFQPFFTTKPTGQGTGLGLSLSYDIIKAHGGELRVETKEGEGAEFFILLFL